MNISAIIEDLLGEGFSETELKNMLGEMGVKTSQPTINKIKNNKAGKIDYNLVNALIAFHNIVKRGKAS